MEGSATYGNLIWTKHALLQLKQRKLSQELAYQAFTQPDKTKPGKKNNTVEYKKKINKSTITLIASKNEKSEWIVISTWIDPPLPGTLDAKNKKVYWNYQEAGFWGKLWIIIKEQFGIY